MSMDDYSIDQMMLFIVGVAGSAGALITAVCLGMRKSRCEKINLCCGVIDCVRDTKTIIDVEDNQTNPPTTVEPPVITSA